MAWSLRNTHHELFDELMADWERQIHVYNSNLKTLTDILDEREKDIFDAKTAPIIEDNSETLRQILAHINGLIDKNNDRTRSLESDKEDARDALRMNEVAKYLRDIEYDQLTKDIEDLQKEYENVLPELQTQAKRILALEEEKRKLETQAQDESRGAELVNKHLSHFFGHNELRLVAVDEDSSVKFKVTRGESDARNLSEGECSLISFCYFIAKIQDELNEETNTNKLILYIDDPISSLDNNHIFFMFSLIEGMITKPGKYNQLFISTHNLDFLKYLKRLTIPKVKALPESKPKASVSHLMMERLSNNTSVLRSAPEYLKVYITEFNYLFEQLYRCAQKDVGDMDHHYQYNFGNNARKFLESYLYFKYPSHLISNDSRLELFFDDDVVTINLIRRVINEYSHLENHFDRAFEPIDEDVIKNVAVAILRRIESIDPDQYNALVQSIAA